MTLGHGMFTITGDGVLVPMIARAYDSESVLQRWLEEHPDLLAGDQIDSDEPRRWLLIRREAGIPDDDLAGDRWSVDHLFIDQDGIPTFVEVKRSSDTRIRREVIGQMLDYAANGTRYWPVDRMREMLSARCAELNVDPEEEIRFRLGDDIVIEDFWALVASNVSESRIRLLFVADQIPRELLAVVEFLNQQMERVEVLAIEIHQFAEDRQDGLVTLVPRVLGQTVETKVRKGGSTSSRRNWDEASFFADATERLTADEVLVARKLFDWLIENQHHVSYGHGNKDGSFIGTLTTDSGPTWPFICYSNGFIEIPFRFMARMAEFNDLAVRQQYLNRLLPIQGFTYPNEVATLGRAPSIRFNSLVDREEFDLFLGAINWFVQRSHGLTD